MKKTCKDCIYYKKPKNPSFKVECLVTFNPATLDGFYEHDEPCSLYAEDFR